MISITARGVYLQDGAVLPENAPARLPKEEARRGSIAHSILREHNILGDERNLRLRFDALTSHDITYVGVIQTARASGLAEFPVPYALTNCHNSLCAVGGTINEDDHVFGFSAAKKYGGIFVPAHLAVIHQFAREILSGCGRMVLGSDSHTRYGALGTLAVGEGGPEIVKQLLKNTYDIPVPEVLLVKLTGAPRPGVGPHDVALAIIGAIFPNGFAKNRILEFYGDGVKNLSVDFRNGIDVMTTETACLSSIWTTDEKVREYFEIHDRPEVYRELTPLDCAYYDGLVEVDLSKIDSMIALPFHPSNVYSIKELIANAADIFADIEREARGQFGDKIKFSLLDKIKDGGITTDQGVIAGCAGGTFENICAAADILGGHSAGDGYFGLSVYPQSQPVNLALTKNGVMPSLMEAGTVIRTAFCGPCFGAGDVPSNNGFSVRHTTRNFPNREGSKPGDGQIASVALMDARSIAATALNGGVLTPATDIDVRYADYPYEFDRSAYDKRVYFGFGKAEPSAELRFGPNIADWPEMDRLADNLLLELCSVLLDPVTTTDELIPSGETSSYRSNPLRLAEFTLSRRDPAYVARAKAVVSNRETLMRFASEKVDMKGSVGVGSCIFANKPGDGSAREQAASCQRVLGGLANICHEYATKRYRSNLINWGILPFTLPDGADFGYSVGDLVVVSGVRSAIERGEHEIPAKVLSGGEVHSVTLCIDALTDDERDILLKGCLINYYAEGR